MNKSTILLLISGFALITQAQVSKNNQLSNGINSIKNIHSTHMDASGRVYEMIPQQINTDKPSKVSQDIIPKTVDITAGRLLASLNASELSSITSLTITGTMDARDFKTMRDSMPQLSVLDFSGASILEYYGSDGSNSGPSIDYRANEIPESAFYISNAFQTNYFLTKVVMPLSIRSIGSNAFKYCYYLNSVNIPESLVTIGSESFYDCQNLTSFFIPSSVTSIGDNAFLGCICLITVDPANLNFSSNDGVLFDKNKSLLIKYPTNKPGEYIVPSSVKNIDNLAFFGCNGLTSVTIPSSVTTLGSQAFSYCRHLTSIFIPSSVTYLSYYVFLSSLCAITVDPNNPNYSSADGVLFDKSKSELIQATTCITGSYNIPVSVIMIDYMAFQDCVGLTAVAIPSNVTTISGSAFYNCNLLTSINVPASVYNIGSSAFSKCSALTSIYASSSIPVDFMGSTNVFYGVDKTVCTLYVPAGSVAAYASADQWSDFTSVVETTTGLNAATFKTISVYPNPVTAGFRVSGLSGQSSITLTDLNGSILLSKPVSTDETVSVNSLPKGVYILKISDVNGIRQSKLVKN